MPRGGRRVGQPGKGYSNRTDLLTNRAPTAPQPPAPQQQEQQPMLPPIPADQVPNLSAPTQRPNEDPLSGLQPAPVPPAPAALPPSTPSSNDMVLQRLRAALLVGGPNPDLERLVMRLEWERGRG
jgi:hypothetical protein